MRARLPRVVFVQAAAALGVAMLTGCGSTGGTSPNLAETPMCTILASSIMLNPLSAMALVSERTDSTTPHGFTRFRGIAVPRGNPAVGFTPDNYGISEAWTRNTAGSVVVRGQSHPARRGNTGPFSASAWTINTQDARGIWSPPIRTLSAQRGSEIDDPVAGSLTTPQLMPVGIATPQVFGCAGERSEDEAVRSTWLIEVTPANSRSGTQARVDLIQDLLNGDDRFVRNPSVPLGGIGPNVPPTPRINGLPGHPVREGSVKCTMMQFEDDVATRELHMVALRNGMLYHSMASNFSAATRSTGLTFSRFNTVSTWGDVGGALGGNFGNIVDVALVARPNAVSVFFVAESGGTYKLWHAVRFSAHGGSWRPADDVFAKIGIFPRGRIDKFRIAAGMCPTLENPYSSELVYAMWVGDRDLHIGRMVSTPRQWTADVHGIYSHLFDLSRLKGGTSDTSRQSRIENMQILARPFRDDAHASP